MSGPGSTQILGLLALVLLGGDRATSGHAEGLAVRRRVLRVGPGEWRLQWWWRLDLLKGGVCLGRGPRRLPGRHSVLSLVLLRGRCWAQSPGQGSRLRRCLGGSPGLRMDQRLGSGLGLRVYLD